MKRTTKLKHALIIVSIITITIIGLYVLSLLANQPLSRFFGAARAVIIPFSIAFFLSFIIGPLAGWFRRKLKMGENTSILLAIAVGVIGIVSVVVIAAVFIATEIASIAGSALSSVSDGQLTEAVESLLSMLEERFKGVDVDSIMATLSGDVSLSALTSLLMQSLSVVFALFRSVFSAVFTLLLTPVFMYYLIREKTSIFNALADLAPSKVREHVIVLGKEGNAIIGRYFKGQGTMMGLIFAFFAVTLSLLSFFVPSFNILHALLFALLMGLFAIIPYLGAWIGLALPVLFLFATRMDAVQDGHDGRIYVIAIIIVIVLQVIEQVIESSVVSPLVMGKEVRIHPLAVLSAFIFFGGLFGFVGVLLAVPMAGMTQAVIRYLRTRDVKASEAS